MEDALLEHNIRPKPVQYHYSERTIVDESRNLIPLTCSALEGRRGLIDLEAGR